MNIIFWGPFLIILGGSLIGKAVFGWDFPVLKLAFGCLLIYWGLQVIFDMPRFQIATTSIRTSQKNTYSTVWANQRLDLSTIAPYRAPYTGNLKYGIRIDRNYS